MTIVVGVAAPDGIILAADSRTTVSHGTHHRVASDSTQKIFSIGGTFAVATYGLSFVGPQTIAGHMDEFEALLDEEQPPKEVDAVARRLAEFFHERLEAAYGAEEIAAVQGDVLGFVVAGYDAEGVGHIRDVGLPGRTVAGDISTATIGVLWRGQTGVVRRLIKGVDWDAVAALGAEIPAETNAALDGLAYNLLYPMTLQDAVDFARFLIRTTIDMQRFSDGLAGRPGEIPGCGGPLRIIAVTRAGVEWVEEPRLQGRAAKP